MDIQMAHVSNPLYPNRLNEIGQLMLGKASTQQTTPAMIGIASIPDPRRSRLPLDHENPPCIHYQRSVHRPYAQSRRLRLVVR